MKSLKILWKVVADEMATICRTSATRDYETVSRRVESEGNSFLTITLPAFGKGFERALELQQVDPSLFLGFHSSREGPLPVFLGGFLGRIFDRGTGRLLPKPDIDCIFAVRQLTLMYSKILLQCSDARVASAMSDYVKCEQEVVKALEDSPHRVRENFRRVSALLFEDVFGELERKLLFSEIIPSHGPGSTADKLVGNGKFDLREWPARLEDVFPFGEYAIPNWKYYYQLDRVDFLEPGMERPVKVTPVPKTLKTPRIIAIEPTAMQYMQQAISRPLVELLESRKVAGNTRDNLCSGFVGFTSQHDNRRMARLGSATGRLATIDMAEASDRVSIQHVADLLSRWPLLQEAVGATRSTKAEVPGFGIIPLTKFASMGSALCFPMEAMVFTTAVFVGIESWLNRQLTRKDVKSFLGQVRVYGDDIIVPTDSVRHVISTLESLGFKVNKSKSFWNGKFRESCGGDYYENEWVTPVRVRRVLPQSRADVEEVISLVSLRNQFYLAGLWRTAGFLDERIRRILPHYPIVEETSPVLGRLSFLPYQGERDDPYLHRPLVKGYRIVAKPPKSPISGEGALLKCLLKQGREPFADSRHLERQGRPRAVGIKLAWSPPY
jgi:hypothetical protein